MYRQAQSRRSKLFKPWTGWQSRWSRSPLTLWRPRLVQNLTNERKLLQKETIEDIADYQTYMRDQQPQDAATQTQQPKPRVIKTAAEKKLDKKKPLIKKQKRARI